MRSNGSCRACTIGHLKTYENKHSRKGVKVRLLVDGKPIDDIPEAALPPCGTCPKPELDPSNFDAVVLFNTCINQQVWNDWSGERLGLRMEAVTAALDELCRQGQIEDRARAFDRVWIIDRIVNDSVNAHKKAEQASNAAKP